MYLQNVKLTNWRSYEDAEFRFDEPTRRRPLVLVGAMNGHGKTSFLVALYLGLFGRFGLRHAEGFASFNAEDLPYYKEAIRKFRRNSADPTEPTVVDLLFVPTDSDSKEREVRVVRRWHFTSTGQPRQNGFEEVELYIDGKPQRLESGLDAAHDRLERLLFPAHVMPAFFFDGEQAQSLINNSGADGIKKSVEVLFGTKVISEVREQVKSFLSDAHSSLGGRRNLSQQQQRLAEKVKERDALDAECEQLKKQLSESQSNKQRLGTEKDALVEKISRLGLSDRRGNLEEASRQRQAARTEREGIERDMTSRSRALGLALAVSRLAPAIRNRIDAEERREQWEALRQGTVERSEYVLQSAFPEPQDADPILGVLTPDARVRLRQRFSAALEQIYNPPPIGCASEFLYGHAKGDSREELKQMLARASQQSGGEIRAIAKRLKVSRETEEDLRLKMDRLSVQLPKDTLVLQETLKELDSAWGEESRKLGSLEREEKSKRGTLQALSAEIGQLQERLASTGPEQQRIAVAERVSSLLAELEDTLGPVTVSRLQELVSVHFRKIADRRFKSGEIVFPSGSGGSPVLRRDGYPDLHIDGMSGFERRAFGIAFSLALIEITKRRLPLVIDTPLGNADNQYRPRLLKAITDVDVDQLVVLTHDAEVNGKLFEEIESQVQDTFLVEFDGAKSLVQRGQYFPGGAS